MSGIMTAAIGVIADPNILYGNGLYNTTTGVDLSPISASAINTPIDRTWIGYFTPASTTVVPLWLQTTATPGNNGGSASTVCRLWFGAKAISGFTDLNADIVASGNQVSVGNFSMTQGEYYPIRIRWIGNYVQGTFGAASSGSITFYASGSTDVNGRIFYNTLTNGF